ncbi:MAG: NAD(P)H-dependent oxidoreductase subunit E [Rhodothermus sp.]|nr:NAD(P)H-dependent oxidoreductase subunit E [Rhodothermus sp.]
MADFVKKPVVPLPDLQPEPQIPADQLYFTEEEKQKIARFKEQYLDPAGAVMKTLWLAQEKFGFLPPEVLQLVADELGIPYAQVYGVATFYTQYYKEKKGRYVLDVCTCFSCQVCGGYDILHYLEEKLGIHKGETTPDGLFTLQEVECLGACGSAPVLQVSNGPYVHNLTPEKVDQLLEDLKQGKLPPFVSLTLPQDEAELGGNRRSDAEAVESYQTPPVAQQTR